MKNDTKKKYGILAQELEELGQIMVKQLKNRYNDPSLNKKFIIGIDKSKMKLYDVEQSAQNIVDSGQEDDPIPRISTKSGVSPFNKMNKFKGIKV
jgi:hypothetical protein